MPLRIATEEQRRRRAVFSATLRAAVFWVPAGVARSTSIRTDTGASLAPWPAPKPQAARTMVFPGQHTLQEPAALVIKREGVACRVTLPRV
jgi:hypothetical protein